ncbi:acetate--CoA ligase family protein [Actinomadura sp. 9N407]|uniref:acetate--CoA ligase family protein n=1 Tax=Actinomadura sp. 9N407 TaxID=3375154 RepID=UPI0037BA43AD
MNGNATTASRLAALFNPRSIALVGATDKSGWSLSTFANLGRHGFTGQVHLVNPRTEVVHGQRAHKSLSDIAEPVDLAFIMVPTGAVQTVLEEGVRCGIRDYVILTAGYGETGDEGQRREDELAAFAREHDLRILGPNGNGYINAAASITPYGLPIAPPLVRGSVGVVLQSGALATSVLSFAQSRNIGISMLTAMGNETVVSITDVVDHLIDDPATKVIALFLESVRHPDEFARAARRALAAGKPIVALKIGRSAIASRAAQAHTGALVGDDRVVDAAFRQLGVVRVGSLEDLIITAGLLAETGPLPGRRLGVVTPSGGACEIIADRAEEEGLELPPFDPRTVARLKEILPAFATPQNPLDVTGYVVVDRTLLGRALEIVAADPGIDAVLGLSELPRHSPADPEPLMALYEANARRLAASPRPTILMGNALIDISPFGRSVQERTGYPQVVGGIEHGMRALAAAATWSEHHRRVPQAPDTPPLEPVVRGETTGVWAEHRAAELLRDNGIPVIPGTLASTEDEAAATAERLGYPVVLKLAADGLAHKSDIGGVRLGLRTPAEVRDAHRDILAAAGEAGLTGAATLVQPQRDGGVELLIGVIRDPAWGPVLAVALGGVWVEVLRDSSLRLLPVDATEIRRALGELRGIDLLLGARGAEPADLDALSEVIARVGALAGALGERLESLETNPLLVNGKDVEALDALVTWRP